MISIDKLNLQFNGRDLFKDVSFLINANDKIGLVGRNGAGKSTLLKIFKGIQKPDSGDVVVPGDIKLGYLPQELIVKDTKTVFEEASSAFDEINNLEREIETVNHKIVSRTDYESPEYLRLIEILTEKTDRFHILGGTNKDAGTEQTLLGLGFERKDFNRLTSEFSGGWRMRIELAKILLQSPDVFLLDEPTNHLDIESIQWLEDFIKMYPGAVVLISHDRAFLDNVTNRTIEISLGRVYDYKVSYSRYVELRKERREQQMAAFRNQQKLIDDTQDFIERFRYKASKAVQVQSRVKQLEKIDRIEIEEEDTSGINIKFPPAPRSGQIVFEARELSKSYPNKDVLTNVDITIERGDKVAFVGRNGEGKTTLSRIITGELDCSGSKTVGYNISLGYFAQNQDELVDGSKTVLETIDAVAVGDVRTKIRDILGAFLFRGEDVDKKVRVLSGGERSRLAMARLLLQPYNLLLLDEPTNHLDMRSKDILKQALLKYDGTLIIVSHDRDFLDGLVDKVYEFKNKKIKQHLGGIYNFLSSKKMSSLHQLEVKDNKLNLTDKGNVQNKASYSEKKDLEKEIKKINNQVIRSEELIHRLENEIAAIEAIIANPHNSSEINKPDFYSNYENRKHQLELELKKWEELNINLEELKNKRN